MKQNLHLLVFVPFLFHIFLVRLKRRAVVCILISRTSPKSTFYKVWKVESVMTQNNQTPDCDVDSFFYVP